MTDSKSLRTRIAEVISDELFKRGAYTEYGTDDEPGQWERVDGHINLTALADAVIRELAGSDCIYRYACHRCGDFWFDKSERMQRFALLHRKAHADE